MSQQFEGCVPGQVMSRKCPESCDWIGKDVTSVPREEEKRTVQQLEDTEIIGMEY